MYVCMYVCIGGNINICNHGDERFLETSTGQSACSRLRCPLLGMYVCMYVCMSRMSSMQMLFRFFFVFSTGKLHNNLTSTVNACMYVCMHVYVLLIISKYSCSLVQLSFRTRVEVTELCTVSRLLLASSIHAYIHTNIHTSSLVYMLQN